MQLLVLRPHCAALPSNGPRRSSAAAGRGAFRLPRHPEHRAATHRYCAGRQPAQVGDEGLSPQEALLAALAENGLPVEAIQMGRAPGDDETWEDLLDAETEDAWMRDPKVPEIVEELLGGDLLGAVKAQQQQQQQSQQQQQRQQPPG